MQIKTKAIVLRAQDYNENDKLLTLLTKERGLVFAYVFGARKMKSRLSAVCSMLCYGEFVLFENKGKYSVDNAESERLFFGIRQDLEELAYASYFCELCAGIVPAEEPAEEMLRLLLNTLSMLENKKLPQDLCYETLEGLRKEAAQKLSQLRPDSVGQASRISGVSPADINVLLIHLEKMRRGRT